MRRIISVLLFGVSAVATAPGALAAGPTPNVAEPKAVETRPPLELAPGAPDRHIVVPGDTLWSLAAKYLKSPHRWGELWKLNADDIKSPQRLYPGQVIVLDKSGHQPHVRLETIKEQRREYVEGHRNVISSIPPEEIEPFLAEPRVLDKDALESTPRVVGLKEGRVIAGTGDQLFTTPPTVQSKKWQVFRPLKELKDPETKEVLGYEAYYIGSAKLTQEGDPSTFTILSSREEMQTGDRLLPSPPQDVISYIPRAPDRMIKAKVLASYAGVNFTGPQAILTLNRGKRDGLEPGHVLAVDLAGTQVIDRYKGEKKVYTLPDSRNGLVFVFRVFDRVSYALVMSGVQPVLVGDTLRTP